MIILFLLVFTTPALAQYWGHYTNARFGYAIDVPPDFEGNGEASDGAGQAFYRTEAEQSLEAWGGPMDTGLDALAQSLAADNAALGWGITMQTSTPQWATLSGLRDRRSFFQRLIVLCDGKSYASMRVDFPTADLNAVEPVLQGLARSFVAEGC
ncbi:hypothetical protein [Devosia lucknowensis]|uniref:hypothetical protein n=1 Tax=Devosia lucknowensis TaxID=1096929 RepID=UPI00111D24E5|nr:hypothetical protein [Devosia lucknowensis]